MENAENGIGIAKTQDTLTGTKGVLTLRVDRRGCEPSSKPSKTPEPLKQARTGEYLPYPIPPFTLLSTQLFDPPII